MTKKKSSEVTYNEDGTFTLRMVDGNRSESLTVEWVNDDHAQRFTDLFRYFGIDSALAGKPVQSDIDAIAARTAGR